MHPLPVILVALALPSLAATAAAQSESPHVPAERGTWYLAGGSSALFESVDGGDYGDTDSLGFSVTGGTFVADGLLLRGMLEWTSASQESGGLELDEHAYTFAAGLRYYPSPRNTARPYLGIAAGIESLDEEIDNGALGILSDEDSYPVFQGELGCEVMISRSLGIDIGLVGRRATDVELFGLEDDLTSLGLVVGLSAWL
jgi:hypothetical protein